MILQFEKILQQQVLLVEQKKPKKENEPEKPIDQPTEPIPSETMKKEEKEEKEDSGDLLQRLGSVAIKALETPDIPIPEAEDKE